MNVDSSVYITVAAAAGVFLLILIGVLVTIALRPRMRLKKRIQALGTLTSAGNLSAKADNRRHKRIQDRIKGVGGEKNNENFEDRIANALLQAGIQARPQVFILVCIATGFAGLIISLILGLEPLVVGAVGIASAVGLPKVVLSIIAKRRQNEFTKHFAEAIDVITRGIRSGLPVGECLAVIAREFEGPVGEEFTMVIEGQRLGMTLEDILTRALKRIPTPEFKFFAIVLQIQKQTGGNLADTLENLTEVLRDRKRMKDKVRALSSEAKSSAAIIACLPFFVLGMLSLVNPKYVGVLFTDGIHLVYIALGMMALGVLVMRQMINFDI